MKELNKILMSKVSLSLSFRSESAPSIILTQSHHKKSKHIIDQGCNKIVKGAD